MNAGDGVGGGAAVAHRIASALCVASARFLAQSFASIERFAANGDAAMLGARSGGRWDARSCCTPPRVKLSAVVAVKAR